ncbi:hypothetical protein KL919_002523 [Ogataea angusta]|nr:hypothetical protein KL943_002999 [Ogataea angusta]KAG7859818.1 hypothetical protein KL919_002523 [Ogataea angusta]
MRTSRLALLLTLALGVLADVTTTSSSSSSSTTTGVANAATTATTGTDTTSTENATTPTTTTPSTTSTTSTPTTTPTTTTGTTPTTTTTAATTPTTSSSSDTATSTTTPATTEATTSDTATITPTTSLTSETGTDTESTSSTSVSPTIVWVTITENNSVATVSTTYSQKFSSMYSTTATPSSGVVGLGSLTSKGTAQDPAPQFHLIVSTDNSGSSVRDHLANERGLLAYMRTALNYFTVSISAIQLFKRSIIEQLICATPDYDRLAKDQNFYETLVRPWTVIMSCLGLVFIVTNLGRFVVNSNHLTFYNRFGIDGTVLPLVFVVMIGLDVYLIYKIASLDFSAQ